MKNYDDLTNRLLARRDGYVAEQKKKRQLMLRVSASVGCLAVVTLAGVGLVLGGVFDQTPPVTPATDDGTVTTTTVDVPTEGEATAATTTTVNTTITTIDTTTDGGIVTPTTVPSKTTTAPSKTESTKTSTTTVPAKLLITADEPDDYKSNINESSLNTIYISGALQLKMQEYSNLDVVYAVIVEVLPGDEDAFWESTEELKQFNKEYYDVVWGFDEEAKRLNPDYRGNVKDITVWTDALRESHERVLALVAESKLLTEKYSIPYQEYIMNQRFEVLKSICNTEPIVVWRQNYGPVYFNGYYVELTAEQINILAEQGGYTFRLAMPDKIDYAYWEYLE